MSVGATLAVARFFRLPTTSNPRAVGDAGPYKAQPKTLPQKAPLSGELSSEARLKGLRRSFGFRQYPAHGRSLSPRPKTSRHIRRKADIIEKSTPKGAFFSLRS